MAGRPIIGVTSYGRADSATPSFSLPCGYVDSLRKAGAIPLVLPPGEDDPAQLLTLVDGLLLAGGGDISPAAYGGAEHETVYSVSEERDQFEFTLARQALHDEVPLLCICRGLQLLNVVQGGNLHAHVPDTFGDQVPHRQPPRLTVCHPVRIAANSRLAEIVGTTATDVCSWHHQAIDRIGNSLTAVAWAEDGVVEALELAGHPWCMAVQWHPEMQPDDVAAQKLFASFTQAAAARRR